MTCQCVECVGYQQEPTDAETIIALEAENADLRAQVKVLRYVCLRKQARIDALMLEFCAEEMTQQQLSTWGEYQTPISSEEAERIHAAIASEKDKQEQTR